LYSSEFLVHMLQFNLRGLLVDETASGAARYKISARWTPQDDAGMIHALRENGFELAKETRDIKFLIVNGGVPPETAAPSPQFSCEASPALVAAITALPPVSELSLSWDARMAPRHKLSQQFGGAIANMAVQDAILDKPYLAGDWDSALAEYRQMSDRLTVRCPAGSPERFSKRVSSPACNHRKRGR
jgi:hypothetical protein